MRVDYNKQSNPKRITTHAPLPPHTPHPRHRPDPVAERPKLLGGERHGYLPKIGYRRIVSTDKKAQKAGGLCLALKGVTVKPTDDVDVDKEYQLIPLDSL